MADDLDRAKDLEIWQRDNALKAQALKAKEPPQDIDQDGNVWCIDCGDKVAPERLNAKPNAARCIDCQGLHELKDRC